MHALPTTIPSKSQPNPIHPPAALHLQRRWITVAQLTGQQQDL
jgi:hypothetical protein